MSVVISTSRVFFDQGGQKVRKVVTNMGPGTLYYGDQTVTTATGTAVVAGGKLQVAGGQWMVSDSQARLEYTEVTQPALSAFAPTAQDFGAVGDGIADDTVAVNNLLSRYGGTYATVELRGAFRVTGTIQVPSAITVDATRAKFEHYTAAPADLISATDANDITVIGGEYDGRKDLKTPPDLLNTAPTPPTASASGGTLATGTYSFFATAVNTVGETGSLFSVPVDVTGPTGSVALTWNAVTGATFYYVYVVKLDGTVDKHKVVATTFTYTGQAPGATGLVGTTKPPLALSIGRGISFFASTTAQGRITVRDTYVHDFLEHGIRVGSDSSHDKASVGVDITGNTILNCGNLVGAQEGLSPGRGVGIWCFYLVSNLRITGNYISGCVHGIATDDVSSDGTYGKQTENMIIADNVLENNNPSHLGRAITVEGSKQWVVTGNVCRDHYIGMSVTDGQAGLASGPGVISGNVFTNNTAICTRGLFVSDSSDILVAGNTFYNVTGTNSLTNSVVAAIQIQRGAATGSPHITATHTNTGGTLGPGNVFHTTVYVDASGNESRRGSYSQSVLTTSTSAVTLTWDASTPTVQTKTRVYRGTTRGVWDGYFEVVGAGTTVVDTGFALTPGTPLELATDTSLYGPEGRNAGGLSNITIQNNEIVTDSRGIIFSSLGNPPKDITIKGNKFFYKGATATSTVQVAVHVTTNIDVLDLEDNIVSGGFYYGLWVESGVTNHSVVRNKIRNCVVYAIRIGLAGGYYLSNIARGSGTSDLHLDSASNDPATVIGRNLFFSTTTVDGNFNLATLLDPRSATASKTPTNPIAAGATWAGTTISVLGAKVGQTVRMDVDGTALPAGLIPYARVTAADTVTPYIYNSTGGGVTVNAGSAVNVRVVVDPT